MPTRHRAKSSAVSCFLNRITSASVALSFLPLSTTFGSPLVFGAYGVIGVFATVIYAGTLPHTVGVSLEDMHADPPGLASTS